MSDPSGPQKCRSGKPRLDRFVRKEGTDHQGQKSNGISDALTRNGDIDMQGERGGAQETNKGWSRICWVCNLVFPPLSETVAGYFKVQRRSLDNIRIFYRLFRWTSFKQYII